MPAPILLGLIPLLTSWPAAASGAGPGSGTDIDCGPGVALLLQGRPDPERKGAGWVQHDAVHLPGTTSIPDDDL